MKPLTLLAAAAGLSLLATGGIATTASAAPSAVVKGHVTSPSGAPISGVVYKVVRRVPGLNFVSAKGRTSPTGRYEVRLPRGGSYQLVVTDPGDEDQDPGDGRWAAASKTVRSSSGTVRIDATMQPGAKLSGHVYDSAGRPVRAGLVVHAERAAAPGASRPGGEVGTTRTRPGGIYRFSNLPAGATVLRFEPSEPRSLSRYYTGKAGGSARPQDAAAIRLTAGKAVTRTSFRFMAQHDPLDDLRPYGAVDPVGDAPAFLDITDLRIANEARDLVVTTTIPGLDPATLDRSDAGTGNAFGSLTLVADVKGVDPTAWTPRAVRPLEFDISVGPGAPGAPLDAVSFDRYTEDDLHPYGCEGLTADVQAGGITTTIPQSCFRRLTGPDAGAVRIAAIIQGNADGDGVRDDTVRTRWMSRG